MPTKRLDNRNSQLRYGGCPLRSDTHATKDGEYSRVSSMQIALYPTHFNFPSSQMVTTTSQVEPATEPTIQKEISGAVTTRSTGRPGPRVAQAGFANGTLGRRLVSEVLARR